MAEASYQAPEASRPMTSGSLNFPNGVDYRALAYVKDVDENLMCSICHAPLVDPVDTECNHTFCRECIGEALTHSSLCPMDRHPLSRLAPLKQSHKIVRNQLDALLVQCICCEAAVPRSLLENHVDRYCKHALVVCPGQTCKEFVKRHLSDKGCLHYDVTCPDCKEELQEVSMEWHREEVCNEREKDCEYCGKLVLRCKENEHLGLCPDVVTACKWAEFGCNHKSKRKELSAHGEDCTFKLVGPVVETLKSEISSLNSKYESLMQRDELHSRRIKFLEGGLRDPYRALDFPDMSSQPDPALPEAENVGSLDTSSEYMLSLMEAQENRIRQLSAGMNELEARQTVILFNETMPIKNEMAELRSTQQVISMHVRWLMQFRRQEQQRRGTVGGPGPSGGSDSGGASGDTPLPRRLSDTTPREVRTRL